MPQTFIGTHGADDLTNFLDKALDFLEIQYGLGGDDTLDGGWGGDILDGGEGGEKPIDQGGGDWIVFTSPSAVPQFGAGFQGVTVRLTEQYAIDQWGFYNNVWNIENIRGTDDPVWADLLVGDRDDNVIEGLDGNDTIYGAGGVDIMRGGEGNDVLIWAAGDGRDLLFDGGPNTPTGYDELQIYALSYDGLATEFGPGNGLERITGVSGPFPIIGSALADNWDFSQTITNASAFYCGAGNDNVTGTTGNDLILGETDDDDLRGFASAVLSGNDSLWGGDGHDVLRGFDGDDQLLGGEGEDTLLGGAGSDDLAGNGGVDHFIINLADVAPGLPPQMRPIDQIFDFQGAGGIQPSDPNDILIIDAGSLGATVFATTPSGIFTQAFMVTDIFNQNVQQVIEIYSTNGLPLIYNVDYFIV